MSERRTRAINDDLRKALLEMSSSERLELIGVIWDSLADEKESEAFELTVAQREDLDRRIRDLDENPDRSSSWEEVRQRIRTRR